MTYNFPETGPVKRARGNRIYTHRGKRFLDLCMDDVRAVTGHRPNGLSLALKNVIEAGLYACYPTVHEERLGKFLKKYFKEYSHVSYIHSLNDLPFVREGGQIADPLFQEKAEEGYGFWRPYLDVPEGCDVLLPLCPLPGLRGLIPVLSKNEPQWEEGHVPGVAAAGILRSFYDYIQAEEKADRALWKSFDSFSHWTRKGPFLIGDYSEEEYEAVREKGFSLGILLNPWRQVNLIPSELSKGEMDNLRKLLKGM